MHVAQLLHVLARSLRFQPSLRDGVRFLAMLPGVETPGYYQTSSGRYVLAEAGATSCGSMFASGGRLTIARRFNAG